MEPKVNYTLYKKFDVISDASLLSGAKDVILRFDGDVNSTKSNFRRCVFNNKGNVSLMISRKVPSTLMFDNDGDVFLDISADISNCSMVFFNRGNVTILGRTWVNYAPIHNVKLYNEGDVSLHSFCVLESNWKVKNHGNLLLENVRRIGKSFTAQNEGDVNIVGTNKIYTNVKFINKGDIVISESEIDIQDNCVFENLGDVIIKTTHTASILEHPKFRNKGYVSIFFIGSVDTVKGRCIEVKNREDFYISGIKNLELDSTSEISPRGKVYMRDILTLDAPIKFRGGRTVYLDSLSYIKHPKNVEFANGGDVMMRNLELHEGTMCPILKCAGNVWVKSVSCKEIGKRVGYHGIIYTETGTYFSNESYVKRNNIKLDNGYMILYKGVGRNGVASYDECSDKWEAGKNYTVEFWNPYDKEIGYGKYVASYDTKIFKQLIKGDIVRYFAIEVHISDIFEYPFAKYPQLIGFRKAMVLYEVDESKNKLI